MTQQINEQNEQVVRRNVTVQAPADRAFALFTDGMATWWPRENTFAKEAFETVIIEPRKDGRWFERDTDGNEAIWGRVPVWDPPRRLVLTWQITPKGTPEPNPDKASQVEVHFVAVEPSVTHVMLEHREFERHGEEGGRIWCEAMDSADGWTKFLDRYVAAIV